MTAEGVWPTGPFEPDAPAYARAVAGLAVNVSTELARQRLSQRAVAREADLTASTVNDLIRGTLIPDAGTISALERALGRTLWPGHRLS